MSEEKVHVFLFLLTAVLPVELQWITHGLKLPISKETFELQSSQIISIFLSLAAGTA